MGAADFGLHIRVHRQLFIEGITGDRDGRAVLNNFWPASLGRAGGARGGPWPRQGAPATRCWRGGPWPRQGVPGG